MANGHAVEQFHAVQKAWEVVRDTLGRRRHREALEAEDARVWRPEPKSREPEPPAEPPPPPADRQLRISILRSVAERGGRLLTRVPLSLPCPGCEGSHLARASCRLCQGRGSLELRVKAWLTLPPEITSGQTLEVDAELELYGHRRVSVQVMVI